MEIVNYISRFKSLPLSSKRLISLGMVLGMFVALPLFIWAVVTQTFLINKKAASGEPVPLPTPVNNSVAWNTPYASLTASNFYINIDSNKLFVGNGVNIHSDPGDDHYTTLELTWRENNVDMGMTLYFEMVNGIWKVSEVRTGDGTTSGTTLYYSGFDGNSKGSPLTATNFNLISNDGRGFVHFENLRLEAFLPINLPISPAGYILEPKPLIDAIYMIYSSGNNLGYGVNVVLRKPDFSVVTDQLNVNYQWTTSNANVATVQSSNLENSNQTCSYGISLPCPNNHGDITAKGLGTANIRVNAIDKTTGGILATARFKIIVVSQATPKPTPTPTCRPRPACLDSIPACEMPEPIEGWCATPTPSPTPRPTSTVSPTLFPSPTPEQYSLRITTNSFYTGRVGEHYGDVFYGRGTIVTTEPQLTLTATNLPSGFSVPPESCGYSHPEGHDLQIECTLTGQPTESGTFQIQIELRDNFGNFVTKNVPLTILPVSVTPSPLPIPGDVNQDGIVNIIDIGIIIDNYRMTPPADPRADVNHDGIVNIVDIGIVIDNYQF